MKNSCSLLLVKQELGSNFYGLYVAVCILLHTICHYSTSPVIRAYPLFTSLSLGNRRLQTYVGTEISNIIIQKIITIKQRTFLQSNCPPIMTFLADKILFLKVKIFNYYSSLIEMILAEDILRGIHKRQLSYNRSGFEIRRHLRV